MPAQSARAFGDSVGVHVRLTWITTAYGNFDLAGAALVGIPAVGGAIAGTALQQRIPERAISVIFAVLLLVIAGELIVE